MKDRIYPILVTDRGERIGLIGYSTEHLIELAKPTGVVYVKQIEAALRFWVKQIQMMGVNKIIAISHAGFERDKQVAASVEGIDVIVGSALGAPALPAAAPHDPHGKKPAPAASQYPTIVKGVGGQSVVLVHAGEFGRSLGRLDVTFDAKGVPKHWQAETFELTDAAAEDSGLRDLVASLATSTAALPAPGPTTMR
jgi:2',3'-cyclic-nucleotide 2'-phosphodiesterase (5'-nucleotidase family)